MSSRLGIAGIVLLAAFGLAACGGGGGGTADTTPPPPTQAEMDAMTIANLQGQIDALRAELGLEADDDLSTSISDLRDEVADLRQQIQDAADAEAEAEAEKMRMEMAAAGKALYGKLSLDGIVEIAAGEINITDTIPALEADDASLTGLTKQDAAVAKLGAWSGADYMKTTGTGANKITATARVYSNPSAAMSVSFRDRTNPSGLTLPTTGNAYGIEGDNLTANANIAGSMFPTDTAGTTTYAEGAARSFAGTYMGASGTYSCTGADACTAQKVSGGITLAGTWTFTPALGATVSIKDDRYTQFGWWLRKDADGPTHASAFYRFVAGTGGTPLAVVLAANMPVSGTATYNGKAAGKFAIRHGPSANAGHFTADAMLKATFSGGNANAADDPASSLTGMIDNFMLNDTTSADWSVTLNKANFDGTDTFMATGTTTTPATQWSVGGDMAPGQTGAWESQAFDEEGATGGVSSNVPTTVVGKFEAGFGSTHEMVGAFGATK